MVTCAVSIDVDLLLKKSLDTGLQFICQSKLSHRKCIIVVAFVHIAQQPAEMKSGLVRL